MQECSTLRGIITQLKAENVVWKSNCCSMMGVYCKGSHIISLWTKANITGSISKLIGNLSKLQGLFLEDNRIMGSIPQEIGNLTDLTHLELGNNMIDGNIPESIANLSKLESLDLSRNRLYGNLPCLTGLSNLRTLYLDQNSRLIGGLDASIAKSLNLNGTSIKVCDGTESSNDCKNINNCKLPVGEYIQKSNNPHSSGSRISFKLFGFIVMFLFHL